MELYSDNKPKTTLKGTGYKDKSAAKETIKIIKTRSIIYQKTVIITMRYRAYYHKYKTEKMEEAIKIFDKWLAKNKNKKIKYKYKEINENNINLKKIPKKVLKFYNKYKEIDKKYKKMPFLLVDNNEKIDYDIYREKLIDYYLTLDNNKQILNLLAY